MNNFVKFRTQACITNIQFLKKDGLMWKIFFWVSIMPSPNVVNFHLFKNYKGALKYLNY